MLDELIGVLEWLKKLPDYYKITLTNRFGKDGLVANGYLLADVNSYPLTVDTNNVLLSMFTFDNYNQSMMGAFEIGYYEGIDTYISDEKLVAFLRAEIYTFVRQKRIDEIMLLL